MHRFFATLIGVTLASTLALASPSKKGQPAKVGKPAPDFTLVSSQGKSVSLAKILAENKTKPADKKEIVVLEWFNNTCPYVKKFYDHGKMQELQKKHGADRVRWLTILSGPKITREIAEQNRIERKANSQFLIDQSGTVGHLYGAKTTPHMFVIDPEGVLVYQGAIDDQPSDDAKTLEKVQKPYLELALAEVKANTKVTISSMKPYGCSVKY